MPEQFQIILFTALSLMLLLLLGAFKLLAGGVSRCTRRTIETAVI